MEDVMLIHIRQLCAVLGEEPRYASDTILPNEYKTEKGQIVRNMSNWLGFMTYDVLGELCFGKSFNLLIDGARRDMVHLVDRAAYRHYVCGLWMPLDRWGLDKIFIRKLTMDRWNFIMKSRAEATERAKERVEAGHEAKKDFFYYLLNAKDPETGEGLSMKELWGEANVLMVAGSDTTSTSIVATLFYLVRHPEVMSKLKREVRSSFTEVEQIVSGPGLNDLTYLKACIDEAMRLSPAVPGSIPREAMEGGAEVDGVFLPAGSECGTPAFSIHRSPDYYREPLSYMPERWIEGATCQTQSGQQSWKTTKNEIEVARNAFCPFSIGPRGCIGKSMALMEMRITLARLMFLFDIELADRTGEDTDGFLKLTDHFVSAKTGPNVFIRRRQDV
ncbi:cytochrome P450 monooxygenase, putative [Talaromyces stipitatus ATCC 10500]|nr:cytochrome P450 monooxygenase, putative [Talaromyces stipitatus ATCC 10500]EED19358.1 cytochrome P450 monooxygenase, putative [Talaromyces stipitatus ATCC 10500]